MKELVFLDETIDTGLVKNYHISIQAGLDGFSFCVLDDVQKKFVALKYFPVNKKITFNEYVDKFESYILKDELLSLKGYKSSRFIANHRKVTLIPAALFSKENLKLFLDFNTPIGDLDEIHYNKISEMDAYAVFTVNNDLSNILFRNFEGIKFFSQATPFLKSAFSFDVKNQKSCVYANVSEDFIDIAVVSGKKLLLYNSFDSRGDSDLIYYILNVYEQLKLDREKVMLVLSGKSNSLQKEIKKYIFSVRYQKLDEAYSYSYKISESDYSPFINLLKVIRCE